MKINRTALLKDLAADMEKLGFAGAEQEGLVDALLEVLAENLPDLRRAVNLKKLDEIAFYAHSLKGTFNNFALPSFVRVTELVTELELTARQAEDADFAPGLLLMIEAELAAWISWSD